MATETEKQLKRIADALDRAYPAGDESFTSGRVRLTEVPEDRFPTLRRLLNDKHGVISISKADLRRLSEQPQAEGDWLLETERAEAGDDVD